MTPATSPAGGHPIGAEFLLDYATGTAPEPIAVLVAAHAELNPASRAAIGQLEATGGALLDGLMPASIRDDALDRVLARLEPQERAPAPGPRAVDTELPRTLQPYAPGGLPQLRWRRLGGIAMADLPCRDNGAYRMSLLRIAPGGTFPAHGHSGLELLLVLKGGFTDEHGRYRRGDVCASDEHTDHRPVADPDGECLCLAVTQGPVRLRGVLGYVLGPFLRR